MAARTGTGHTSMIKSTGTPGHRIMAVFTRFISRNMGVRLTDRIDIVMTGLTIRCNTGMIKSDTCPGDIGDVAVITGRIGLNMIGRFTRGGNTVMATFTRSGCDRVIKGDFRPVYCRGMAAFTSSGSRQMGLMLAGCTNTIVAGLTTAGDTLMVESFKVPAVGVMAIVTGCSGWNMIGMFTCGDTAIMAGLTSTRYTLVIKV